MRDAATTEAIKAAGGISALADLLGIRPQAVAGWRRVPAERCHAVSAATDIPLFKLRPDLWPPPPRRRNGASRNTANGDDN